MLELYIGMTSAYRNVDILSLSKLVAAYKLLGVGGRHTQNTTQYYVMLHAYHGEAHDYFIERLDIANTDIVLNRHFWPAPVIAESSAVYSPERFHVLYGHSVLSSGVACLT